MISKTLLFIPSLILFSYSIIGQGIIGQDNATPLRTLFFEYDKQFYHLNYSGIKNFTRYNQSYEPEVYNLVATKFEEIKTNRQVAIGFGASGTIISAVWMLSTISSDGTDNTNRILNNTMLSMIPMLIGGTIYLIKMPNESDFLDFISYYNTIQSNKKIDLRLSIQSHTGLGPALLVSF